MTTDADIPTVGCGTTLIKHEYPITTCGLEEGDLRYEDRLRGFASFKVQVIGLPRADIARAVATEHRICAELALANLRINLTNKKVVRFAIALEGSRETNLDAVDVVLVYLRLYLEVTQVIHLTYRLPWGDALSECHIQQSQLTINRGAHLKFPFALTFSAL